MVVVLFCLDFQQSSLSFVLGSVFDGLASDVSNSNVWMILVLCVKLLNGSIFFSILPLATDMSRSVPGLSMPMSFPSPPVTHCWALEDLFAFADPLGSFGPKLFG